MAYDALAESLRLIISGLPDGPVRLSRRRRFAPVAVDVDGNVAATRFLRRGVGCYWDETHLLAVDNHGAWRTLGGGGASYDEDPTAEEFERARDDLPPYQVAMSGSAGVVRDGNPPLPWGRQWVRGSAVLVGHGVAELHVNGRHLPVPYHGHLIVVWSSRRPPTVTAHDGTGRTVATATVSPT
ncbi:hypothetical protein GCE86_09500 [Micromonospora terminaliae]|uniref:Uncharacterized protein n=1 Tax=Micromonospora terminaliae TaxID=1914461 RepID=A0AAJ2ZFJ0_9ACTN|nr:hypothetical protein [Micromonospora terminaliae]NES27989.1 hypothetical protein [Micromonospora terminaliae]QGL47249.1 hypothetical protein GCE86_09500 [Micromonospora terminaliae]